MKMADCESKKRWDKENVVFIGIKLFRSTSRNQNDQEIIDYLDGKVKGEVIKAALREYIQNHKGD